MIFIYTYNIICSYLPQDPFLFPLSQIPFLFSSSHSSTFVFFFLDSTSEKNHVILVFFSLAYFTKRDEFYFYPFPANDMTSSFKLRGSQVWWCTPVILAIQEVKKGRLKVQGQRRAKLSRAPSQKQKGWGVAQIVDQEKCEALGSVPSTKQGEGKKPWGLFRERCPLHQGTKTALLKDLHVKCSW
jgi:hypothetical protein